MRCTKCGVDHSAAIGCGQALRLAQGGSCQGLPSARAPTVALTRCQVCRKLHAPHCGAAQAALVDDAQPTPPDPAPATPKARRPRKTPHAGGTAASLGEYMQRRQEAAETAPVAAIDAIETATPTDSVASVTETAQNGSNPEKSETTGSGAAQRPRGKTNAERQAAHRERHRDAIRIIDRERKRAQKGKTA